MEPAHTLTLTLQQARKAHRVSQLELALRLGVSQRHVSFVETGRARPSRELLMAWLVELEAPLVVRNEAMLQAGYAPIYGSAALDDPALAIPNDALVKLLDAHDPMPAFVMDADWNVLRFNRGAMWLAGTLLPDLAAQALAGPVNMLDLLAHPNGFCGVITNLAEVGPALLAQLRHETASNPRLTARVEAFATQLEHRLGGSLLGASVARTPVLTTRYTTPHGKLAFFSMFTTFGAPQDVTLASLRVEHLFAADDETAKVLRAQIGPG